MVVSHLPELKSFGLGCTHKDGEVRPECSAAKEPAVPLDRLQFGVKPTLEMEPLPASQPDGAAVEELIGQDRVVVLPGVLGRDGLLEIGLVLHLHQVGMCLNTVERL